MVEGAEHSGHQTDEETNINVKARPVALRLPSSRNGKPPLTWTSLVALEALAAK